MIDILNHIRHTVSDPNILTKIALLSLITIGICCTFWDDMIFDKAGDWVKAKIGEFWAKPLFGCYVCATFWYSIGLCLLFDWAWYLCLPAMGVSAVVSLFARND